jgi:hypothetical protein
MDSWLCRLPGCPGVFRLFSPIWPHRQGHTFLLAARRRTAATINRLRELNPAIKVIIYSGRGPDQLSFLQGRIHSQCSVLAMRFTAAQLLETVGKDLTSGSEQGGRGNEAQVCDDRRTPY